MKKSKFITEFKDIPSPREKMPHLPLDERKENFVEVELGFNEERALVEAKRCLSCRRCIGCGLCLAECDPRAIVYDDKGRTINLKVNTVILTPGLDEFDAGRISELGYRKFPNVVTSIELERMLSPTGPYGGFVLRPSEGRVPAKIAFVQCVGSRNEAIGADFCSSICCMTAMKEALALTKLIPSAEVTLLHRDIRPLGKDSEGVYQDALKEKRIRFLRAGVTKISDVPESGNLIVELSSDGDARSEEYELVVLSVGIRAAARTLSRKAGVRLNKYGFCNTDALNPGVTSKKGIMATGAFAGPVDITGSICQATATAAVALRDLKGVGVSSAGLSRAAGGAVGGGRGQHSRSVLVVGSGLAGLVAASELSRTGHEVTIIEKEKEPGGVLSRYPFKLDEKAEKDVVSTLLESAKADPKIKVLASSEIIDFSGDPGNFSVTLRSDGGENKVVFGAVIVCTGGKEYVPEGFLHGKDEKVLTQLEFEEALGTSAVFSETPSVVMLQCAGSRSSEWPVCSRVCCAQALKNALALKKSEPRAKITILHRGIRVYGLEEELLSECIEKGVEFAALKSGSPSAATGPGVQVKREEKAGGEKTGSSGLVVSFEREGAKMEAGAGTPETLFADYVILSTGFRPPADAKKLGGLLGTGMDAGGFFDALHPKLNPVQSSRKGVYICGLAHSPQTVSETIIQAVAAAWKASSGLR